MAVITETEPLFNLDTKHNSVSIFARTWFDEWLKGNAYFECDTGSLVQDVYIPDGYGKEQEMYSASGESASRPWHMLSREEKMRQRMLWINLHDGYRHMMPYKDFEEMVENDTATVQYAELESGLKIVIMQIPKEILNDYMRKG